MCNDACKDMFKLNRRFFFNNSLTLTIRGYTGRFHKRKEWRNWAQFNSYMFSRGTITRNRQKIVQGYIWKDNLYQTKWNGQCMALSEYFAVYHSSKAVVL
jgi:hypothetical protein